MHRKGRIPRRTKLLLLVLLVLGLPYGVVELSRSPRWQLFGERIHRADTSRKLVALTIDDGPRPPYANELLDVLASLELPATFFVVGRQVEAHPQIVRRMVAEGHEVGNHSYSHTRLILKSTATVRAQIERTDAALRRAGVRGEIHFRAPYGQKLLVLPWVLRATGRKHVLWDVDARDYELYDPEAIASHVARRVGPGSIVLMHQNSRSVRAVALLAERLRRAGYRFVTVSELLRSAGSDDDEE